MCLIELAVGGPDVGVAEDERPDSFEIEIYLEQDVREVGPRVVIGKLPTGWPKLNLVPRDALRLSSALARLARTAAEDGQSSSGEPCDMSAP